jgi:hypothetical protein
LATFLAFLATPATGILGESLKEPAPFLPAWAPGTRRPSFSMARMLFRIQKGLAEGSLARMCFLMAMMLEPFFCSWAKMAALMRSGYFPAPGTEDSQQPSVCQTVITSSKS